MYASKQVVGDILEKLDGHLRAVEETERTLMAAAATRGSCDADLMRQALARYHDEARRCFEDFRGSFSLLVM